MIATCGLTKRFRDGTAIAYRDMAFETGKTYALLGASGCGKTTLLNMIAGVLSPTSGSVEIDGRVLSAAPQREKDRFRIGKIGYIFQDFKLIEMMSVEDNIRILELEHVDTSEMNALLEQLGILRLKRRRVSHLSGGEKQRVAIARALCKRPDIILADEPTGNLNFETGYGVVRALIEVAKGKTLIAVTHDDRLAWDPNPPGKLPGDHAGHMAADRFGGSPELDNIVAQLKDVNLSKYRILEDTWAKALENGQKVSVDVRITNDPLTGRPTKFEIDCTIDGVKQPQQIIFN